LTGASTTASSCGTGEHRTIPAPLICPVHEPIQRRDPADCPRSWPLSAPLNPHSRCCSVGCPTSAISCLGASPTPAVGARGCRRHAGVRETFTHAEVVETVTYWTSEDADEPRPHAQRHQTHPRRTRKNRGHGQAKTSDSVSAFTRDLSRPRHGRRWKVPGIGAGALDRGVSKRSDGLPVGVDDADSKAFDGVLQGLNVHRSRPRARASCCWRAACGQQG
jgi:hypothetical protein